MQKPLLFLLLCSTLAAKGFTEVTHTTTVKEGGQDQQKSKPSSSQDESDTGKTETDIDKWMQSFKDRKTHPNVLFIMVDDLRPEIGANIHQHSPWLNSEIVTPYLDKLSQQSLLFRRAYCQFAWCNPSRSSLLTSRRPDTTMVHNNTVFFRENNPNFVTLPQHFSHNGYTTIGLGKIFHRMNKKYDDDVLNSWSSPIYKSESESIVQESTTAWDAVFNHERNGKPLLDEDVLSHAKETLGILAERNESDSQPFFVAVGFKKPHLPFQFPAYFMNNYPLEKVPLPANRRASSNMPEVAWFDSFELRGRKEYENETSYQKWNSTNPLPISITKDLRRAYYSCVTYIDHLVGQLLRHLDNLGLADDTIVSFMADHAFHLGEQSIFGKNTVFEVANNAPLIIRIPGVTDNGLITDKLVEYVDLFPTLAELAGLPKLPYCPKGSESSKVDLCTEGTSLVPLFKHPSTPIWKDRVFYQYPHYTRSEKHYNMGYTMRSEKYRYTEWIYYDYDAEVKANWTNVVAAELYDHDADPHETINLAEDEKFKEVREDLSNKLRAGWKAALPDNASL